MKQYVPLVEANEIPPGERAIFEVGNFYIMVLNVDGDYYALEDVCSHDGDTLSGGPLEGFEIVCPRHGARFDIRTGDVLSMPATHDIMTFPIRVSHGMIEVEVEL